MYHIPAHKNVAAPAAQVEPLKCYRVVVTYRDHPTGSLQRMARTYFNARDAKAYAAEEQKWEDTVRVVCEQLGIDARGDYASLEEVL